MAVTQVLVYIGAIVVLFLFGIMLTRAPIGARRRRSTTTSGGIAGRRRRSCCSALLGYVLVDGFGDDKLADGTAVQRHRHRASVRLDLQPPT